MQFNADCADCKLFKRSLKNKSMLYAYELKILEDAVKYPQNIDTRIKLLQEQKNYIMKVYYEQDCVHFK